jgi:hypothetical protein
LSSHSVSRVDTDPDPRVQRSVEDRIESRMRRTPLAPTHMPPTEYATRPHRRPQASHPPGNGRDSPKCSLVAQKQRLNTLLANGGVFRNSFRLGGLVPGSKKAFSGPRSQSKRYYSAMSTDQARMAFLTLSLAQITDQQHQLAVEMAALRGVERELARQEKRSPLLQGRMASE